MKTSSIEESCFRKRLRARSSRNQLDLSIPFEGRQMTERTLEVDYVIVGSGAVAMAFADTLLTDTEASIVMVDRRHKPGGHWNDSYPFVRLHGPSINYGVNSRPLGQRFHVSNHIRQPR